MISGEVGRERRQGASDTFLRKQPYSTELRVFDCGRKRTLNIFSNCFCFCTVRLRVFVDFWSPMNT